MSRFTHIQDQVFYEKLATGIATLTATALAYAGALLTTGEVRWVCITMASSILMAMFCAVIVKAPTESMKVTVCRAGFSIMVGVLATRELLLRWGLEAFENDAIRLAGVAAGMTIAGMCVGYPLLLLVNRKGTGWAKLIIDRIGPKAGD